MLKNLKNFFGKAIGGILNINLGFVLFVVGLGLISYGFFLLSFVAGIFAVGTLSTLLGFIVDGSQDNNQ